MTNHSQILALPALNDNYIWLIDDGQGVIVIDPTTATTVIDYITVNSRQLYAILLTHSHHDHIGGVDALVDAYAPKVIDNFALNLVDNYQLQISEFNIRVILTPGHTVDSVSYLVNEQHLFCGDTLFSLGCGRVFTGDYPQMYHSLTKIKALPHNTLCYPAHEYTQTNLAYTYTVDDNLDYYRDYARLIKQKLTEHNNSLPISLKDELKYNLFLRCDQVNLYAKISHLADLPVTDELECFIALRQLRNKF